MRPLSPAFAVLSKPSDERSSAVQQAEFLQTLKAETWTKKQTEACTEMAALPKMFIGIDVVKSNLL